jgi:mannose-6-phosphate isomerase-like protein (cupin superfamily)
MRLDNDKFITLLAENSGIEKEKVELYLNELNEEIKTAFDEDEAYMNTVYTGKLQVVSMNIEPNEYKINESNVDMDATVLVVVGSGKLYVGKRGDRKYYDIEEHNLCIIPSNNQFYIHNTGDERLSIIITYSGEKYIQGTYENINPTTGVQKMFL